MLSSSQWHSTSKQPSRKRDNCSRTYDISFQDHLQMSRLASSLQTLPLGLSRISSHPCPLFHRPRRTSTTISRQLSKPLHVALKTPNLPSTISTPSSSLSASKVRTLVLSLLR